MRPYLSWACRCTWCSTPTRATASAARPWPYRRSCRRPSARPAWTDRRARAPSWRRPRTPSGRPPPPTSSAGSCVRWSGRWCAGRSPPSGCCRWKTWGRCRRSARRRRKSCSRPRSVSRGSRASAAASAGRRGACTRTRRRRPCTKTPGATPGTTSRCSTGWRGSAGTGWADSPGPAWCWWSSRSRSGGSRCSWTRASRCRTRGSRCRRRGRCRRCSSCCGRRRRRRRRRTSSPATPRRPRRRRPEIGAPRARGWTTPARPSRRRRQLRCTLGGDVQRRSAIIFWPAHSCSDGHTRARAPLRKVNTRATEPADVGCRSSTGEWPLPSSTNADRCDPDSRLLASGPGEGRLGGASAPTGRGPSSPRVPAANRGLRLGISRTSSRGGSARAAATDGRFRSAVIRSLSSRRLYYILPWLTDTRRSERRTDVIFYADVLFLMRFSYGRSVGASSAVMDSIGSVGDWFGPSDERLWWKCAADIRSGVARRGRVSNRNCGSSYRRKSYWHLSQYVLVFSHVWLCAPRVSVHSLGNIRNKL